MNIEEIKQFMNENLLTKEEGRSTVRLYLKEDVERYNQERLENLKKFGRK